MNQEEERKNGSVETGNGQLPEEAILDAEGPEADGARETEEVDEREETLEESIARLEAELAEAHEQAASAVDMMQRTVAEYENAGKRREREQKERIKRDKENMMRQLLPVLDDLELAFQNVPGGVPGDERAWLEGFAQIQQKLLDVLANAEVEPLAPCGEFDPTRHEAISNEPDADVPSGHIIQTLRTGYRIRDRVLRPALVRVSQ